MMDVVAPNNYSVWEYIGKGQASFYERCTVVVRNYAYVCERSCCAERSCVIDAVGVN
jgi:hypothetical protein